MLHPEKRAIIHINQTGALIWQLCNGFRSVDEIITLLSEAYPEARQEIAVDVPQTVELLAAQGALHRE